MERIVDRTIRDECMAIDGKLFQGCTLDCCILEYSGGPVVFEHTVIRRCRYVFFGPARGTVHFLQNVGLLVGDTSLWAEFPESVN